MDVMSACNLQQFLIAFFCVNLHKEMKPGIFPVDADAVGEEAVSDGCKEAVADIFIVGAHPVNVFFKIAVRQETCEGVLLEIGDGAGVEIQPPVKCF